MEEDHGAFQQLTYLTSEFATSEQSEENYSSFCHGDTPEPSASPTLTECSDVDSSSEVSSSEPGFNFCPLDPELTREVGASVYDAHEFDSMPAFVAHRVASGLEPGSFLVTNLATVVSQYHQWVRELPMVEPFYAVKCNPDPAIVRMLASLGCNFDCATMGEIDLVLHGLGEDLSFRGHQGKAARSIVYANPAKMEHMLQFAMDHGVRMTVFDGEDELLKIARLGGHDKLDLLLRLTTDDKASVCRFSKKFGCPVGEAPRLLDLAKSLGLHVAGVSFHVGSGCGDVGAYTTALNDARFVFDYAASIGMRPMTVVDIGGGFPGDDGGYGGAGMPTFLDIAAAVREGISRFSRDGENVRFIAEPGRYFVSASTAIVTKVYSRKGGNAAYQALYVDDGVYGSFNNVVYDHALPRPRKLASYLNELRSGNVEEEIPSAVFGPTCDGLDQMCSLETTRLPRCDIGDWLIWENQGAYTHTASFVFNGYTHFPNKVHCYM